MPADHRPWQLTPTEMKRFLGMLFSPKRRRREPTAAEFLKELDKSAEYKQVVAAKQAERDAIRRLASSEQASLLSQVPGLPSQPRVLCDVSSLPPASLDALLDALDPSASVPTLYDAFTLVRRCGQPGIGAHGTIAALRRVISARTQSDCEPTVDRDQGTEIVVGEALQAVDVMASEQDIIEVRQLLEDRTLGIARIFLVPTIRRLEPQSAQAYLRELKIHRH
jgi:hypothetical protein